MYAISTPIDDQYAGDGIAIRGVAYGMPTIRVDGNDLFAVYAATKTAREMILREKRPVLIEAISYRVGDHSTSDFSQAYRNEEEMKKWNDLLKQVKDPIERLEKYMVTKKLIADDFVAKVKVDARNRTRDALKASNDLKKPNIDFLFSDVYEDLPTHLKDQKEELKAHLRKYPDQYPQDNYENGKEWAKSN
uniref:2-oxoisovalerate dehydrogenase subunit alpha n=1 Tax=Strombidium rassoulzadegani TaxID=1082188 RepID=A0A7S3FUT9_9SPIT|mmetsp:Transcript_17984/g.30610  ORF Transcript_17984/g.30610 Transcript_17984/m.30610 type:complete len:191 (+) Transcript_17984:754-1326(+)